MALKIYFRWKVTIISILCAIGALILSNWQWSRHIAKQQYIQVLKSNLSLPIIPLNELLNQSTDLQKDIFRRVKVDGVFDFSKEMVLRNRKFEDQPGVFVITPLKLSESKSILVNRGFVPFQYSDKETRGKISKIKDASFIGIIKESVTERFLAPQDPETGSDKPWVDAWLRINIPKIQNQIPYKLLPVYVEIMSASDPSGAESKIIQGKSDRDDMFFPTEKMHNLVAGKIDVPPESYPIPSFDTVVPANRHFGYIFEWGFIALLSLLIGLVLQLKPYAKV